MDYHISKYVDLSFEKAIEKATAELKKEKFGVLTTIDAKATLKEKLDVDFRPYTILGACNPPFAHRAMMAEPTIGTLMPCNVVVQQMEDGRVMVSAMNPALMGSMIDNAELPAIAEEVTAAMQRVMDAI